MKYIRYTELGADDLGQRKVRSLEFFFTRSLLGSRVESGVPLRLCGSMEMTNVYLASLLTRWALVPGFPRQTMSSLEFYRLFQRTINHRQRGDLWRARADHHLLAEGVFTGASEAQQSNKRLESSASGNTSQPADPKGQFCYRAAAEHYRQSSLSRSGLVDVLDFLGQWYADYVRVLRYLASEYFGLLSTLSWAELSQIDPGVQMAAMERFLEALSEWGADHSEVKAQAVMIAAQKAHVPSDKLPLQLLQQLDLADG